MRTHFALAAVVAILGCGCSTTSTPPASSKASASARSHPVQAERLLGVMHAFDTTVRKDVVTDVDEHAKWAGVFADMADAAETLERSAVQLSGHPPDGLELPDRGRFQVLARSLSEAAAELRDAAARNDAEAVANARTRLGNACRDCHEWFRPNSPGVPDAFR